MKNNKLWDGVKTLLNDYSVSLPALDVPILPDRPVFGEIADDEIVIIRSEQDIIRSVGEAPNPVIFDEIEEIIKTSQERGSAIRGRETLKPRPEWGEPCAWYCPLHYFGPDWGIYIREDCVIDVMFDVAHYINWSAVPPMNLYQLRNFAFYYFYFHEQFHHKVESFGLRVLAAKTKDSYLSYKKNVYIPNYGTSVCLEESLASAESFKRFYETRYFKSFPFEFFRQAENYIIDSIKVSPPGYREGRYYLSKSSYLGGISEFQSQVLEANLAPRISTPQSWEVASGMIRGLRNIHSEIYTIVKVTSKSIFSHHFDPRFTTSTKALRKALTKYYGFTLLSGRGKGSHEMLENSVAGKKITLSGNRSVLPLKDVKDVLKILTGRTSLDQLPSLLQGKLSSTLKT